LRQNLEHRKKKQSKSVRKTQTKEKIMRLSKISKTLGMSAGILMLGAVATSALAGDLAVKNWRVFSILPVAPVWDIDKAQSLPDGGVEFPFQQRDDDSYAVYLHANCNVDLTGKTITATVGVDVSGDTQFWTRTTACENTGDDAYVRLEFQSVNQGPYGPSDYWWSTGGNNLNLSALAALSPQTLSISTTDLSKWSNINGQLASADPVGFAKALKNVKQVSLAFGSLCSYASGVAVTGGGGTFQLLSYTIAP
jgi:hypothetical protein